jgi:predicted nucleic-acid-binding protein
VSTSPKTIRAVDTNVVVSLLIGDDPAQSAIAAELFRAGGLFISSTVLLETAWVLGSRYGLTGATVHELLATLLAHEGVELGNSRAAAWALERLEAGASFADALHVGEAIGCDAFLTFDAGLVRKMRDDPPLRLELLEGAEA